MQFLFSFVEEMIPCALEDVLSGWVREMPKAAWETPFPISDCLAINELKVG